MLFKLKANKNFFIISSIIFFSMLLRTVWILKVPTIPVSDFMQYYKGAVSLLEGNGYRIYGHISAYEPVGYSLFLYLIFFFFGCSYFVAKLWNLILSFLTLILIYKISKKYIGKFSYISTLLYGILPISIVYTSVISTEIIFTFLYVVLIYLVLTKKQNLVNIIILGVLLGILTLIKPYMLIYAGLLFFMDFINFKSILPCIKNFLIITVVLLVTISPWIIRNYFVFHKFIPVSTNGGYNLYVNNNDYAVGAWRDPKKIKGSIIEKYRDKNDIFWNEVKVDEEGKKAALNWIMHNPSSFLKLGVKKVKNTFFTSDSGFWSTDYLATGGKFEYRWLLSLIDKKVQCFMLIFMFIYFIVFLFELGKKAFKNLKLHAFIILNILFFLTITFVFEGQPRYLFPLWPIFILAISYAIKFIYEFLKNNICKK